MGQSRGKMAPSALAVGKSIFDFKVKGGNGDMVDLGTFKGKKAFLIVNVATE